MTEQRDELKDLLYKFVVLYERWEADKLEWAKQTIRIEQLLKEFAIRINEFGKIKNESKQEITQSVYDASNQVVQVVANEARKEVREEVNKVSGNIRNLGDNIATLVRKSESRIEEIKVNSFTTTFWSYFITFAIALFVCFLVTRCAMPAPQAIFSTEQLETYSQGQILQSAWSKLSKIEKDRIVGIAAGRPVPRIEAICTSKKNKDNIENSYEINATSDSSSDAENGTSDISQPYAGNN